MKDTTTLGHFSAAFDFKQGTEPRMSVVSVEIHPTNTENAIGHVFTAWRTAGAKCPHPNILRLSVFKGANNISALVEIGEPPSQSVPFHAEKLAIDMVNALIALGYTTESLPRPDSPVGIP